MKLLILMITCTMMMNCIIQPKPEREVILSLIGTWCTKSNVCYKFDDDKIYSGDPVISDYGYDYSLINVVEGGYYQEGIIVSDMFKTSFGDVYYNVKEGELIMFLGGVLFKFDRVE